MNAMNPLTLDQLREFAPAYVFGTLDAQERAAFEHGLENPAFTVELHLELAAHAAAVELLAIAHPVTPPPALKARMMERIAQERQTAQVRDHVREPAMARRSDSPAMFAPTVRQNPSSRATRVVTPLTPTPVVSLASRRSARTAWWTAGAFGTALAAALVIAVDFRNQAQALEERAKVDRAVIAKSETRIAEQDRTLQTLLQGRGTVVLVNLDPAKPAGPGMQVFWNVREGKAVVNAYGLAPVASSRAYMLWMIRDGKPVPLKLFTPGDDGRAVVSNVELPTTTSGVTLLAVTEESSAGADQPTMTPFLVGQVPVKAATQ